MNDAGAFQSHQISESPNTGAALARLLAAIDEQLALSGIVRGPQAAH